MEFWEQQCQLAKDCARKASEIVGETSDQTETTWDQSWNQSWATGHGSATFLGETLVSHDSELVKTRISTRAKSAWANAWANASQANEQYVALLTGTVMEYVNSSVPEARANFRPVPKSGMLRNMAKALVRMDDLPTPKLQDWVKGRIRKHCQRVARMYPKARQPNQAEFEQVMETIWKSALTCLAGVDAPVGE
ncbi:unnamed protein product [Rhizoctonia solani]|uniref:Uncharacterized protein n=1 Tax=Rhizoctonia solani TaxID=456999 RepID=A0A8H2XYP8_9AGAM|nr:unnamed protein product [Rhizoctonia solani]CAE7059134.1 unnamed protein product [Rhizoctonia solani]